MGINVNLDCFLVWLCLNYGIDLWYKIGWVLRSVLFIFILRFGSIFFGEIKCV